MPASGHTPSTPGTFKRGLATNVVAVRITQMYETRWSLVARQSVDIMLVQQRHSHTIPEVKWLECMAWTPAQQSAVTKVTQKSNALCLCKAVSQSLLPINAEQLKRLDRNQHYTERVQCIHGLLHVTAASRSGLQHTQGSSPVLCEGAGAAA